MNKKNKHIFIIGMMGSGKSSLAPVLSKKLKTPFIDTDADLTSILKLDTEEIFTTFSEEKFRILEKNEFQRISRRITKTCRNIQFPWSGRYIQSPT